MVKVNQSSVHDVLTPFKWGSPPLKRFSLDKEARPIQVRDKSSHIAASFFRDFKKHCGPASLSWRFCVTLIWGAELCEAAGEDAPECLLFGEALGKIDWEETLGPPKTHWRTKYPS